MLEPCAVKVASTVLRRGSDCEVTSLSDNVVAFSIALVSISLLIGNLFGINSFTIVPNIL